MDSDQNTDRSGFPKWLLVAGMLAGVGVYFWMTGDQLTATLIGAMLMTGLSGYRLGALKLVGLLGGAAAAIAFAPGIGKQLESQMAEWLGTSGLMNRVASIGLVGIAITLAAVLLVALLSRRLFSERPRLAAWNRWLGFGLGGMQGAVVILILISGLLIVEPMAQNRAVARDDNDEFGQAVAQQVSRISERTRASKLGPAIAAYNPFDHVPQLSQVQRGVRAVSDPDRVNQLLNHPSAEQWTQSPTLSSAIDALVADPEIQEVIEAGKPIDLKTAMSLMNNPAVLKVLDDPDFLTEMSKIVSQLDPGQQEPPQPLP